MSPVGGRYVREDWIGLTGLLFQGGLTEGERTIVYILTFYLELDYGYILDWAK